VDNSPNPRQHVAGAAFPHLARDSAYELLLTFVLLFGVTSIVRWVIGPSSISREIQLIRVQLLIVGVAVGLLLTGLILSPLGKASGGHTNPAISFAMWLFGVFPGAGVAPYAVAQLLGSVLGVIAAREVWGAVVQDPPVVYGLLQPAPGWSAWELFAAEALGMAVIVFFVGLCLAIRRLAPFVPWVVGALVGLGIALLGTSSGGSLNPARQFGPAALSGQMRFLWVYLVAPMVGAGVAVWLLRMARGPRCVLTHRLCGALGE
jgi:glycerol uptake facilitator-like aquaporin